MAYVFVSLASVASAQLPEQFNLECDGIYTDKGKKSRVKITYQVDITSAQWCNMNENQSECFAVRHIEEVTDSTYILDRDNRINRVDGTFWYSVARLSYIQGTCRKASFTGFPKPKL